jgi:hypothetical protein
MAKTLATAFALVALFPGPATASDIVVRGKALSKEEAQAKAQAYVQAVGMVTTVKPAARWLDRVCPKIVGLGDANISAKVEARVRSIASASGARVAKPGCEGNLLVIFTADADDLARRINAADPRQMAETSPTWRGRLVDGRTPIRWWYSSEYRSSDGAPPTSAPLPWLAIGMEGGGESSSGAASSTDVNGDSGGGYTNSTRSSLVSTNVKRAIRSATVLVDVTLANGKELEAVTDYAALVGLAEIRFAGDPPPDSVLSLFAPVSPTLGLTAQDEALLRSLYRLPLDRHGRYHRGWLVKDVSKSLTAGE